MRFDAMWAVVLAAGAAAYLSHAVNSQAASSEEVSNATVMMSSDETEQSAAATARESDKAWRLPAARWG
jgi:hypothetical protein